MRKRGNFVRMVQYSTISRGRMAKNRNVRQMTELGRMGASAARFRYFTEPLSFAIRQRKLRQTECAVDESLSDATTVLNSAVVVLYPSE
jgi:hypothetical protein